MKAAITCSLLGVLLLCPGLGPSAAEVVPPAILTAFRSAEEAEMRGAPERAFDRYRAVLELLAASQDATRYHLMPEAELALRRLYNLASAHGKHAIALPVFETWMASGTADKSPPATPTVAALARFYAGAATLYTRVDHERAASIWRPLGFLEAWWIIGPFDNERGGGFATSFGPESDGLPSTARTHRGKNRQVAWRRLPVRPLTGRVDLDALMHPSDQALAYALTYVHCEKDLEAALHLGSDEGYRLWINGALVASRNLHRLQRFDQDTHGVRLRQGWNSILLKVTEDDGRWEFRARLSALDGSPLEGWKEAWPDTATDLPPTPAALSEKGTPERPAAPTPSPATRALLDRRLEKYPEDAWSHYLKGLVHHEIQAHDISEHPDREALRRALQLHGDPIPASYHYALARASLRKRGIAADRDYNAWRVALEDASSSRPPSLLARTDLARYYLDTFGNVLAAADLLRGVLRENPDFAEARILLGLVEARMGYPNAARKALERCAARGLHTRAVIHHLAQKSRDAGNIEAAEKTLRRQLATNNFSQSTRAELMALLLDTGRVEEALDLLREAIRFQPFDLASRHRMVTIHRGRQEHENALEVQREIVAIAADDPDEHKLVGDYLWKLGRKEEAMQAWKHALELQPNFPELREYLDFLESRRDPFVEEHRRDVAAVIKAARDQELVGDDPVRILLDLTVIHVNPDGTAKEFKQQLIHVLNDGGARLFDRFQAYYAGGDERLEFKVVRVVHRDGREERGRLGVHQGGAPASGTYRIASVDLPPLVKGDLIEVQYIKEALHQSFFGDYFGHREYLRANYPISEKTFILRLPGARKFYFHQKGFETVPVIENDVERGMVIHRWTVKDVDKIKPEPGMPPSYEAIPLLEVSTFENWQDFSRWYENLIRKQFESTPEIRKKVTELTSGSTSNLEKIRALYHFVVQEIRYNAWEFGVHGFKPYNAPTIFARKFGDCKDKATLLTTMLKEVGIDSYPVLIRAAESRGEEDLTLPMVHHFNHCITYVAPGEGYPGMFLDGTAQYNGLEELPGSDRGARVLVVKPTGGTIVKVPWNAPFGQQLTENVQVTFDDDLGATLDIRLAARGDYAAALRRFFEIPGKRKNNLERIFGRRFAGMSIEKHSFSKLDNLSEAVQLHVRLHAPNFIQQAPEGMTLQPIDDFFSSNTNLKGLVTLEDRDQDLILGTPRRISFEVSYSLANDLELSTVPRGLTLENRFGKLIVSYASEGDRILFKRLLELSSPRIDRQEYAGFRAMATALERLSQEKIIVKKTTGS